MSGSLPVNGRALVRDQVAAVVEAAIEPLGGTVFRARIFPLQLPQLPACLVYGWKEKKVLASISSADPRYDVTCHIDVHAVTGADTPEDLEAALEQLAVTITDAVLQAPGLVDSGGSIERIASVETTIRLPEKPVEALTGEVHVVFECEWSESYDVPLPVTPFCSEVDFGFTSAAMPSA